jgi:predicted enzyme related to lactoylglutathione lyase
MSNPVVYFEIAGKDMAVLEDFYRAVFDWQLTPAGENYSHVFPGQGIGGGIGRAMDGGAGHVTIYVEVAKIEETLTVVEGRGGRRIMGPEQLPNGPLMALFADPEGRTIGLIQAGSMRTGQDRS